MSYDIYYLGKAIGKAEVTQQGLYHCITCRCRLPKDSVHRIYVSDGGKNTCLGVCMPDGDIFTLEKKIPRKYMSGLDLEFYVDEQIKEVKRKFIPISPEEPVAVIDKLRHARFAVRDNTACLEFPQEIFSGSSK